GVPWALNCEEVEIPIMPGDVILQYTDGITEAKSKTGEEFGLERLCEVIEQAGSMGAPALAGTIKKIVADFSKGSREMDDVTLVIVEVNTTEQL
ncbi:MAG: SpoIIE family protein phosphatase, partial [Deltaproteobacteria bacterium]|nr:SpoIIE family protein phosphatase [Deltaproteobacteria bacterium]